MIFIIEYNRTVHQTLTGIEEWGEDGTSCLHCVRRTYQEQVASAEVADGIKWERSVLGLALSGQVLAEWRWRVT